MNKQTKIVLVIVLILAAFGIAWYSFSQKQGKQAQQTSEPIKIGQITSLTGDFAAYGVIEKDGADLAVDDINARGGINGRQLVIVREDDRADPAQSVTAINKLIGVDKVSAVVGTLSSGGTLAAAPVAEKSKVVLLSEGAGSVKISNAGDYIFRIYPSTAQEIDRLFTLVNQFGKRNVAIMYAMNEFGTDLNDIAKQRAASSGINILDSEGYAADGTDFRTQLAKIKTKSPEVVFLFGYSNDMGLILKQSGEMGIKTQFMAPDTFDSQAISKAGKSAEGLIYVTPSDETSNAFKEAFKAKYGKDSGNLNAMNYDAVELLALAIERGGNDGTAIKNELYKIRDYAGASGSITIDSNGDAINRPMVLKTVKDGQTIPYQQ
jgi:branched-chain amino acid transport system substrate-binding protein